MDSSGILKRPSIGRFGGYTVYAGGGAAQLIADDAILSADPPAGGTDNVTPAGVSAQPSVDSFALQQVHVLAPAGVSASPTVDSVVLQQTHAVTLAGISSATSVDALNLQIVHALSTAGIGAQPSVDAIEIGQTHALTAVGINVASTVDVFTVSVPGDTAAADNERGAWDVWEAKRRVGRKAKKKDDYKVWIAEVDARVNRLINPPIVVAAKVAVVDRMPVVLRQAEAIDWIAKWETAFPVPAPSPSKVVFPPAPKSKPPYEAMRAALKTQMQSRRKAEMKVIAQRVRKQIEARRRQRLELSMRRIVEARIGQEHVAAQRMARLAEIQMKRAA